MFARLLRYALYATLGLAWPAAAWNANGHRLIAGMAWHQLTPPARQHCLQLLEQHPDYPRWAEKTRSTTPSAIFAEAATWADDIRDDPRYYDADREPPVPPPAGLSDNRRHRHWHYADRDRQAQRGQGELDLRSEQLLRTLREDAHGATAVWALPWLLHLIGDLHQPLHVGHAEDQGGNRFAVENLLTPRQPFTNLHAYWDGLPGRQSLRGERLERQVRHLLQHYPAPSRGDPRRWYAESRAALAGAYPPEDGSLLPVIDAEFDRRARDLAARRLVAAGYRLGWALEEICGTAVARQTPR
ncbi:S1/P1 nuclease [Dechloromonas sp. ZY10]|uniref:S1/P1 nuclease n=1 Tax=Dechloromonas aquae TaxID=2664436 RepID=UPI003529CD4B